MTHSGVEIEAQTSFTEVGQQTEFNIEEPCVDIELEKNVKEG